jgi:hypothetical protein
MPLEWPEELAKTFRFTAASLVTRIIVRSVTAPARRLTRSAGSLRRGGRVGSIE